MAIFNSRLLRQRRGKELRDRARSMVRTSRNALMRTLARSDYPRWTSEEGLEQWWSERTDMIVQLVPRGSRVIEFGAGRRYLEQLLPDCTYTALDLVDRGPGTIVCDLNHRPLPDLRDRAFEVAVFAGVLEYIKDVPSLISWLSSIGIATAIVSFDPMPEQPNLRGRVREQLRRLHFGYMCNMTEKELIRCFEEHMPHMLCVEKRPWMHQVILRFEKRP